MVCVVQIKSQELFDEWVSKLRHHRVYRQNEIALYPNEKTFFYPHYPSTNSTNTAESASIRKVFIQFCYQVSSRLTLSFQEVIMKSKLLLVWPLNLFSMQCMSLRRQSTVHSPGAFSAGCNSQAKVAAWLQSSDDMDKCSKGETARRLSK